MTSIKRIIVTLSFPVLAVYGSFVGLWTPAGMEFYTAEQLGMDYETVRYCNSAEGLTLPVAR